MGRTRILSALVLAIGAVAVNANPSQALQVSEQGATEKNLSALVEEAKRAEEYVSRSNSAECPGLGKYLQKLINYAEAGVVENEAELIKALDEAVVAVPLLVPEKVTEHTVATTGQSNSTVKKTVATNISVKVEADPETASQPDEAGNQEKLSATDANEPEVAELPKTGEVNQAGMGELVLAGAAVLIGTLGATILILRSKKNA